MRNRNQSKKQGLSTGKKVMTSAQDSDFLESLNDGNLAAISHNAVGKLLNRVNSRGSSGLKKRDNYLQQCDYGCKPDSESERADEHGIGNKTNQNALEGESCNISALLSTPLNDTAEGKNLHHSTLDGEEELDDSFWEDGSIQTLNSVEDPRNDVFNGVTVEFDGTPDSGKRKTTHRASAEDKELAELVHKVHLLCLLGRGRLIDNACNDPLIQVISLLTSYFSWNKINILIPFVAAMNSVVVMVK